MTTISASRKPPLLRRHREPGRIMKSKLIYLYPEELERIERASRRLNIAPARFISEAAIARAKSRR